MAEEMGIDLEMYNLLEFEEGWNEYAIESTPTFIHFEDGKEVDRLANYHQDHSVFSSWFEGLGE